MITGPCSECVHANVCKLASRRVDLESRLEYLNHNIDVQDPEGKLFYGVMCGSFYHKDFA